jgi:hypothetical protein
MRQGQGKTVRAFQSSCWAVCVVAAACCGCSVVVDPESLLIRCEVQSGHADPCADLGLICASGTCQKCEATNELCDGRDNDCDGNVDEGYDADGDGFTWCGGGHPDLVDCVPDNASIHPTGGDGEGSSPVQEQCDGLDNDCDGNVDEDRDCRMVSGCTTNDDCLQGRLCDKTSGTCVAPRTSGSQCQSDTQCGAGFCVTTKALGLGDVLADNLCGTACCKDFDCPENSVCVQSGSGARVCLPIEIAGRQRAQAGERCSRSADCASGVCQDRKCIATCSSDADCSGGEMCRLNVVASSLLSGAGAWICGSAGGRGLAGDLCTMFDPTSCASSLCWELNCAAPCGSNSDCADGYGCQYIMVRGLLGGGRVTACVPVDPTVEPQASADTTCCTNSDCDTGQFCRPKHVGSDWGMFCAGNPVD